MTGHRPTAPRGTRYATAPRWLATPQWLARGRGLREESGQISTMMAVVVTALILLAGFLWQSSLTINAMDRALGIAESAARAGAQQLDLTSLRTGNRTLVLDPAPARAAAERFLRSARAQGTATATRLQVSVTVVVTVRTVLRFTDPSGASLTATATARPYPGPSAGTP